MSPPAKIVHVRCPAVSDQPLLATLKPDLPLKQQIISNITGSGLLDRKRRFLEDSLQSMDLLKAGAIVIDFDVLDDGDQLEFRLSERLQVVSASDWTDTHLHQLKVHFQRTDSSAQLLTAFGSLMPASPRVAHVLQLMEGVGADFLRDTYADTIAALRLANGSEEDAASADGAASSATGAAASASSSSSLSSRARLLHPLWKTLYMMLKYPTVEALVDEFVSLLLRELMTGLQESDWLYVFPQLPLPLVFGMHPDQTEKRAIADRTIVDVGSFYRMSVFEDKSVAQQRVNSEPQLIAEAIAAHQANMQIKHQPAANKDQRVAKKQRNDAPAAPMVVAPALDAPMLAVRVNGEQFYFYSVRVTESLLQAMATKTEAAQVTAVLKLCRWRPESAEGEGLSFFSPDDRRLIVETLDQMCQCIARAGRASPRR